MNFQVYHQVYVAKDWMSFKFLNQGPSGKAWQAVQFCKLGLRGYYYAALGSLDEPTQPPEPVPEVHDLNRLIATVGAIMYTWLERFPRRALVIHGPTQAHNRLYRRALNRARDAIAPLLEVQGLIQDENGCLRLTAFDPSQTYIAFILTVKPVDTYAHPPPARQIGQTKLE